MRLAHALRRLVRTWDYLLAAPTATPRRSRLGMEALESRDVPNAAPTAVPDSISVHSGWMTSFTPLDNDSDPDFDPLTASVLSGPAHGSVSTWDGQHFEYNADSGYSGPDSFTYEVSDGNGGTAVGTVTVSVTNDAPTAADDSISLHNGSWGVDVLYNDSDPESDTLTAVVYTNPSHGTVGTSDGRNFDYTPDAGFVGSDWFEYEVSDGNGGTAVGKVDVSVWNTAPTGANTSISVHAGGSGEVMVSGLVSDSESDTITFGVPATDGQPAHGTVGHDEYGNYTYTATDPLFTGSDSFQYTVSDGYTGGTATYTVTVDVTNGGPTAGGDSLMTHTDPVTVWVLDNDSDPDWEDIGGLTATLATGPQHGTVSAGSGGSFTYTPDAGYAGSDSLTYTLSDGHGGTATGTVYVTVTNTPPSPVSRSYLMDQGGVLTDDVLMGMPMDADGDTLIVRWKADPNHGSLTLNLDGNFTYTPEPDFFGTDIFEFTVDDGFGPPVAVSATVSVAPTETADNPSIGLQVVKYKDYFAHVDRAANKAQIYAEDKQHFDIDWTDPAVRNNWNDSRMGGRAYDSQTKIDNVTQNVVKGAFMTNARFSVTNYGQLTANQKAGNYLLQTVKRKEETFDANGALIGRETDYMVEGFAVDQVGVQSGLDKHSRGGMLTGYTVDGKTVAKTVWTAEFTLGFGNYDGKALTGINGVFYEPSENKWDATKLSYVVPAVTYTVTFTLKADKTWSLTYSGALTENWVSPTS